MKITLSELKQLIKETILSELDPQDFSKGGAGQTAMQGTATPGTAQKPADLSTSMAEKLKVLQDRMAQMQATLKKPGAKVNPQQMKQELDKEIDNAFAQIQAEQVAMIAESVLKKINSAKKK